MAEQMDGANAPEANIPAAPADTTESRPSEPAGNVEGSDEGDPNEPANPWDSSEDAGDWAGVPKGARKRIQKLSAGNAELRSALERQAQMIERLVGHVQAQQPELKREDFASEDEYLDYRMEQRELRKQAENARAAAEAEARQNPVRQMAQEWQGKVEQAKAVLPDYEQVVRGAGLRLDNSTLAMINRMDVGPHVLYTIAKTDGLALAMEDMSPQECARIVQNIEGRVRSWTAGRPATPAVTQVPAPSAPPVAKPVIPPPPPRARAASAGATAQSKPKNWIEERNQKFGIH